TGHLYQDAIVALPLNGRFDQAQLVDAASDDLDRLIDHLPGAFQNGRFRHSETHQATFALRDVNRASARRIDHPAHRLRQFPKFAQPLLIVLLPYADFDRIPPDRRWGNKRHARLAKDPPHVILQGSQLLVPHVAVVDFQQDVGTALQVQPQHHMTLRPRRPFLDGTVSKEIRYREQAKTK